LLVNVHRGETKLNQFQTSEMTKSTIIQFVKKPNFDFDAGEEAELSLESEDFTGVYSLLVKQISETVLKTKEKKILSVLKRDVIKSFSDNEVPVRVLMNYARPIGKVNFYANCFTFVFILAAFEMLLENVKMSKEFIDITVTSICESVVNTPLATLVPFLSENSSIVAKETVEDLNTNFEIAVAEAISKKSPRTMFSVVAITKEKFYLEKRFAENISSNCTTKINDLFKSLKQIRVHFFDTGDL